MSITIEDILIIIVVAINTKSGIERSYVVGKEKREATLDNLEPAYYNMTVFVFDTCGQNFSSETVHQLLPSDTTELFSFPEILSTSSPLESSPPASTPELIFLTSEKLLPFGTPETTLLHCIEENSPGNGKVIIIIRQGLPSEILCPYSKAIHYNLYASTSGES